MTMAYAAVFGLAFGSFVNAAIDRIPRGRPLNGRSHCDGCGRTLRVWELVPVASYIALRGRCATCSTAIGLRVPAVELACGGAFVTAFAALATPVAVVVCGLTVAAMILGGIAMSRRDAHR